MIEFSRVWAMPNKHTFTIPPITSLLKRYVGSGKDWADPFANSNSPAEWTNDLNPDTESQFHLDALEFCQILPDDSLSGVLFDPPYSLRQMKEVYNSIGIDKLPYEHTIRFYGECRRILSSKVVLGGLAISFGWNSIGMTKKYGFEPIEIMLVCHGRAHNDTIVTVEMKCRDALNG